MGVFDEIQILAPFQAGPIALPGDRLAEQIERARAMHRGGQLDAGPRSIGIYAPISYNIHKLIRRSDR